MDVQSLDIPDVKLFTPKRFEDSRGFFMETFRQDIFEAATGYQGAFIQDNHSFSVPIYTVRGLHFQTPPYAQGKLVRCTRGRVMDVTVDIRKASPTYGQYVKAELTSENGVHIYVPPGFLHGFATLEANCEIQYKCTHYYTPNFEGSVLWNDPDINIDWGFAQQDAIISERDQKAALFKDFQSPF